MTEILKPSGWYHAEGDPADTYRYWDGSSWHGKPRRFEASATVMNGEQVENGMPPAPVAGSPTPVPPTGVPESAVRTGPAPLTEPMMAPSPAATADHLVVDQYGQPIHPPHGYHGDGPSADGHVDGYNAGVAYPDPPVGQHQPVDHPPGGYYPDYDAPEVAYPPAPGVVPPNVDVNGHAPVDPSIYGEYEADPHQPVIAGRRAVRRGFWESLFDMSFSSFVTGRGISRVYAGAIALVGLFTLASVAGALSRGLIGLVALVLILPMALLCLVLVRLILEFLINHSRQTDLLQELADRARREDNELLNHP